MDADTLNNIASQQPYVLMFVAFMGFMWLMHRQSIAYAVQAKTIEQALSLAAAGQTEGNRLRDESNRQEERFMHLIETMNDRFIMAITGQTTAITRQGMRLDTMDTSLTSLPTLAAAAQGSDAKTDLIVAAIQQSGADIQAVNKKLGYMAVDTKSIAQYLVNPTEPNKQDVQSIADKPASSPPVPVPADVPQVGDEIQVVGTVTGTMTGTVAPAAPVTPA